ncbi:VOC family protein [Endozoicomonas elysicola]|uniref:Glyoxalase/bleomycin resistance protein/dioxygenase n=1 Tax=Endozoicomonas elysicola TaxID=305900 RepID=A0A081KCL1_9GAMM|nr:VOC family protein [Endozoicomonas elysicola]KEI71887.1 glyoxalase/bleomycin resistance protein/dioxygenase [Endozoicomonas elysicola]
MEITLNHTIIPARNNVKSARLYEKIFGFEYIKEWGAFAVIKVNESLTFDFMNKDNFIPLHYAFKVTDKQFDNIFARVKSEGLEFGSGPDKLTDGEINHNYGGRGVYFTDLDGHVLEIITTDYVLD